MYRGFGKKRKNYFYIGIFKKRRKQEKTRDKMSILHSKLIF